MNAEDLIKACEAFANFGYTTQEVLDDPEILNEILIDALSIVLK